MVPIFALAVMALSRRHRRHYAAHLVFPLHFRTFWLLLICATLALTNLAVRLLRCAHVFPSAEVVSQSIIVFSLAIMTACLFRAMCVVFDREPTWVTAAKALALGIALDLSLKAGHFVLFFITFWSTQPSDGLRLCPEHPIAVRWFAGYDPESDKKCPAANPPAGSPPVPHWHLKKTTPFLMKNRTATTAQTPEALLNDLRALVTEAEKMLSDAPDTDGAEAVTTLRARFDAAQERFADLYASAKKNVTAGAKYTDDAIRANPYQSLAIALGAGLLVGVLLGRRSK